MKSLLVKIGLSILIYLLDNEVVHNAIMKAIILMMLRPNQ
jgi:hypothetical protein